MDEETCLKANPWPVEEIQNECTIQRHFFVNKLIKDVNRRFPPESEFIVRPGEDGLSFYWEKHISLKNIYLTIALSYNHIKNFKDYTAAMVFGFLVSAIREMSLQVTHSPAFFGNPSEVGYPNNRSHVLVKTTDIPEEDFLEIRSNLSVYCQKNHSKSFYPFDVKSIKSEVETLRKKGNDTPFHKD